MNEQWSPPSGPTTSPDPPAGPDVHTRLALVMLMAGVLLLGSMVVITGLGGVMLSVLPVPRAPGEPEGWQIGLIGIAEALMFFMLLLPYGAAVVGVLRRRPWGQYLGAACFGLWSVTCLAPFGVYGVWALMRSDSQRYFTR